MDRGQFCKIASAFVGGIALAPTLSLCNLLSQTQERDEGLDQLISDIERFNNVAYEVALKTSDVRDVFTSTNDVFVKNFSHILLAPNVEDPIERLKYKVEIDPIIPLTQLLNSVLEGYFRERGLYFSAGYERVVNHLFLDINIRNIGFPPELKSKYDWNALKTPITKIFGKEVNYKTEFLGKSIIDNPLTELRKSLGGGSARDTIFLNSYSIHEKVKREYNQFRHSSSINIMDQLREKSWQNKGPYTEEGLLRQRFNDLVESLKYHEAAHIFVESIFVRQKLGPQEQSELLMLRGDNDETIAFLAELMYGNDQYNRFVNIVDLFKKGFYEHMAHVIFSGFEEYYQKKKDEFLGIPRMRINANNNLLILPDFRYVQKDQIRKMAEYVLDENYRKPPVVGQSHYETRKLFSPVFQN